MSLIVRLAFVLAVGSALVWLTQAAPKKYRVNGPLVTITLKDRKGGFRVDDEHHPWVSNLASLNPKTLVSVESTQQPLPNWLPSLKAVRGDVLYEYNDLKRLPSRIDGTAKFSTQEGNILVQPSFDLAQRRTSLTVQASRGASYILATVASHPRRLLRSLGLRGSFLWNLPYETVSAVRVTPTVQLTNRLYNGPKQLTTAGSNDDSVSCTVEAVTGGAARTKAILRVNTQTPTLAVVHALDARNTVSPEINLFTGRIVYQWDLKLGRRPPSEGGGGIWTSLLRTRVDPLSAIHLSWTDTSAMDGGSWVTDVRLPLEGTTLSALAANVRIQRQFRF